MVHVAGKIWIFSDTESFREIKTQQQNSDTNIECGSSAAIRSYKEHQTEVKLL